MGLRKNMIDSFCVVPLQFRATHTGCQCFGHQSIEVKLLISNASAKLRCRVSH